MATLALLAGCGGGSRGHDGPAASPDAPKPVGPYVADPANPTKKDTHWHAALGVYDCDRWLGDGSGAGIWNWPFATPQGAPARATNTNMYAGLHTHDDGLIHMEPAAVDEAGWNATVGRYFEFGGWKLSGSGFTFLGTSTATGKCGTNAGKLSWAVARWDGTTRSQHYKLGDGDPAAYKLYDMDIVVIAFLPSNREADTIGNPPSVGFLASELGPLSPPVVSSVAPPSDAP